MLETPSRTAHRVALRRATHQLLDHPVVFHDPLALPIAGVIDGKTLLDDPREQSRFGIALRAFMAARSRLTEDLLAGAVERGVDQYVVLGAGLDTFAYRNPYGDRLRVFEVDHPATQAWKRQRLEAASIAVPASLTFVPVDFANQETFDELKAQGFDAARPAWFSWLGVTMYLESPVVWSVLTSVARLPPGSGIVFDYAVPPEMLGDAGRRAFEALADRVAQSGEPFVSSIDPRTIRQELRAAGYSAADDFSGDELNRRYFDGRTDNLRVGRLMRMASAAV
ncbi:MAG: class I SAM-dependent methyltransferase [Acidobacteriaceae bacterium]|jgi:methyltransferase (TIGR00027 family)|nr:class I SAM-dependent methyltransferase [Acidobacteriaceae bacterium]